MKLPFELLDHIYTSLGGYKTVYSHPDLDEEVCGQLEKWGRLWTDLGGKKVQWYSRPFLDYWLFGKVFPAGVDHAGRPRVCVHSILIRYANIKSSWRTFNPLLVPQEWFLGSGVNFSFIDKAISSLARHFPDAVLPMLAAENLALERWSLEVALTFFYAQKGAIFLGGLNSPPQEIINLLNWLPFVYRKRWAMLPFPVIDSTMPLQIVLSAKPRDLGDLVVLAEGFPPKVTKMLGDGGIWSYLLDDGKDSVSRSFDDFYNWFYGLPLDLGIGEIPSLESENWLQVAFQCLDPLNRVGVDYDDENKLPSLTLVAQFVLGMLSLGWAGFSGAAAHYFGDYCDMLIDPNAEGKEKGIRFISESADLLWTSTVKIDNKIKKGAGENTQMVSLNPNEENYSRVTLIFWQLLYKSKLNRISLARLRGVPAPDLRAGINPWSKRERTLLWLSIAEFLHKVTTEFIVNKTYYFSTQTNPRITKSAVESIIICTNLVANLYKTKKLMAPDYQQQFSYFINTKVTSDLQNLIAIANTVEKDKHTLKQLRDVKLRLIKYSTTVGVPQNKR